MVCWSWMLYKFVHFHELFVLIYIQEILLLCCLDFVHKWNVSIKPYFSISNLKRNKKNILKILIFLKFFLPQLKWWNITIFPQGKKIGQYNFCDVHCANEVVEKNYSIQKKTFISVFKLSPSKWIFIKFKTLVYILNKLNEDFNVNRTLQNVKNRTKSFK